MIVFVDGDVPCKVEGRRAVKSWLRSVADHHGKPLGDLSVVACSDEELLEYNRKYLDHDTYTDIITFDYSEADTLDGELIICPAVAAEYGQRYNVALGRELARYFIHGVLHLQGHDDHAPNDRRQMKREENRLLTQLAKRFPVDTLANG